jgi:hypothetical protein
MNLPDEQHLRTSERRDFLRCPQKWWWGWREGLRAMNDDPDALWFGTGIHQALAEWYCGPGAKRGRHPAETWAEYASESFRTIKTYQDMDDETEAKWIDAGELGRVMMEEYVKLYGQDDQKLIISPEKTFKLPVPWPQGQMLYPETCTRDHVHDESACVPPPNGGWLFNYVGTFDGVWRDADSGHILLDEHKTAAQIATGHLPLDPQAGSYWAVAGRTLRQEGLIGPKEKLWGIEYNFMRKALPDERPRDAQGYACNKPEKKHYVEALLAAQAVTRNGERMGSDLSASALMAHKLDNLRDWAEYNGVTVLGERSKVQPAKNFERVRVHRTSKENIKQLTRMQQEGLHMQAIKDGVLPVLKNPDRSCNQGAMRCQFYEMCEYDEAGGDWREFAKEAFVAEDPYADHRLR